MRRRTAQAACAPVSCMSFRRLAVAALASSIARPWTFRFRWPFLRSQMLQIDAVSHVEAGLA